MLKYCLLLIAFVIITVNKCNAQSDWNDLKLEEAISIDSTSTAGFKLVFINKDDSFNPETGNQIKSLFKTVYPKEVKAYNQSSLKRIILIIDPKFDGVAATDNGIIRVSSKWLKDHPADIDLVTHELMHIVQSYPEDAGPGWITEGIADYVRYQFGVQNDLAKWSLPAFSEKHNYDNAYRVTARFFVWIEQRQSKGFVKKLDKVMRSKTYTDAFWKKMTGKTVDELWKVYVANQKL